MAITGERPATGTLTAAVLFQRTRDRKIAMSVLSRRKTLGGMTASFILQPIDDDSQAYRKHTWHRGQSYVVTMRDCRLVVYDYQADVSCGYSG